MSAAANFAPGVLMTMFQRIFEVVRPAVQVVRYSIRFLPTMMRTQLRSFFLGSIVNNKYHIWYVTFQLIGIFLISSNVRNLIVSVPFVSPKSWAICLSSTHIAISHTSHKMGSSTSFWYFVTVSFVTRWTTPFATSSITPHAPLVPSCLGQNRLRQGGMSGAHEWMLSPQQCVPCTCWIRMCGEHMGLGGGTVCLVLCLLGPSWVMMGIGGCKLTPPFGLTCWNVKRDDPTDWGELFLLFALPSSIILSILFLSDTNLSFAVCVSSNCWIRLWGAWRACFACCQWACHCLVASGKDLCWRGWFLASLALPPWWWAWDHCMCVVGACA